ncbi:hypothetical protein Mth01_35240 [Sphaerimonospora thailandensis]|uniref:PPM-type phosphatase domain-containing protein n=2 Tax=Sphaerimonospora TaxID=1792303 RepID=A0A8J3RBH8_9ACTN|nr:hypothetical protein Mth01_35240 [Sphaerimonospora thailandensis]
MTLPAASNVQWLVDLVQQRLHVIGSGADAKTAGDVFDALGRDVRTRLADLSPHDLHNHPCCSIGLAVIHDDYVQLGRIGDATIIAYRESEVAREISTDFFEAREAGAVERARSQQQTRQEIVDAMFARRTEYIKGVYEESVFSGHPDAVFKVHAETLPLESIDTLLLCTDGFARAVADYRIFPDWHSLGHHAREDGLDSITARIRQRESGPTQAAAAKKFKNADDLAAILLTLESEN